jgi:hypothetical protein
MASLLDKPGSSAPLGAPRVRLQPVRFHDTLLDGSWWPASPDLAAELPALVPILDHVRGPVTRLLLSAVSWTTRPHHVVADGREVSVGYFAAQSPSLMTVLCADGGTFVLRVTPPGPAPVTPELPMGRRGEDDLGVTTCRWGTTAE